MKRLICALFGLFISVSAFADGIISNPEKIKTRIRVGWDDLSAVIENNTMLKMGLEDIHQKYDDIVAFSPYEDRLSTADMETFCYVVGITDSRVCYDNLVLPLVNRLEHILHDNVCAEPAFGYRAHCLGGLYSKEYELTKKGKIITFVSELLYAQDVKVPEYTAYGLAIEYIRNHGYENYLNNIRCSPYIHNDWIHCTAWRDASNMNSEFFSFHFADTHSREDKGWADTDSEVYRNTVSGICAMFGLFSDHVDGLTNRQVCRSRCPSGIKTVASKFSMTAVPHSWEEGFITTTVQGCLFEPEKPNMSSVLVLKTYPDNPDMSRAFETVQTILDPYLIRMLELYIRGQGVEIRSFECNYAPIRFQNDYILPCVLNGEEVEFLFDDLYESEIATQKAGHAAMSCLTAPAVLAEKLNIKLKTKLDGKYCIGPGEEICTTIMGKVVPGGVKWDPETDRCILKDVAKVEKTNFINEVVIGGLSVIVTCASGFGTVMCVVTGVTELVGVLGPEFLTNFEATRPNTYAKAFVNGARNCKIPDKIDIKNCSAEQKICARNTLNEFFGTLGYIIGGTSEDTTEYVAQAADNLSQCIDDSVGEKIVEDASIKFEVTAINLAEVFCVAIGFANPNPKGKFDVFTKFQKISRWLKNVNKTRLSKFSLGNKWYRIDRSNISDADAGRYITRMKDQGFVAMKDTDPKTGKKIFRVYMETDAPGDIGGLAAVRSEIDKNMTLINNGRIRRITFQKTKLSDDEWDVLRKELDKKGFDIVEPDFEDSFWVIKKSSRSGRNANSADVKEKISALSKNTNAKWKYVPSDESVLGYSYYSVRLSDMNPADAKALQNRLKKAGVRMEIRPASRTNNKGDILIVREEHIGDVGRVKPLDFEEGAKDATGAGARAGQNTNATGAGFAGETPVNPELTVNVTRTDKGIKIEQREFVSAVDENGDKYFRYMFNEMDGGAPESARRFANNLRESGVDAFVVEHNGVYGVGVYERTLKNIDGVASATASGVRYHADLDAALDLVKTNPTKASRQLLQKYHPDKLQYHSDEIDKLANEITRKINSGLDKMSDAELRGLGRQMNQLDDMLVQAAKKVNINPSKNLDDLYSSTHVLWEYDDVSGVYRTKTRYVTMDVDGQIALENMFNKANVRMELDDAGYLIVREEHIGDLSKASSVIGAKNVGNASAGFMGRLNGWKVDNVELVRNNSRNAVFKFKEKGSGKTYYLKHVGDQDEIARTKRAYEILGDNSGVVHTARVVEDDQDVLIDFITKNNLQQTGGNYWMLTEEVPSSVAFQGNVYNGELKNALRGKPITIAEQQEIRNAIKKLNDGGIVHGDLYPNMLFMRESNGKLRVDLIDYENLRSYDKFADERWLDNMFNELRGAGLAD